MEHNEALGVVRLLINNGLNREDAINNPAIPGEYRNSIKEILEREDNIILMPANLLSSRKNRDEWLNNLDRSEWCYWSNLRGYLLGYKNWSSAALRSLDETTDRILGQLEPPYTEQFDIRGLVLGYVQSGKTANFTALIAKAADVGYRLVIVLSGIDNGLRRQTQIRLNRELIGYADSRSDSVHLPPMGKQWHQFTTEDINGDFQPGNANYAALQGSQPVLLVIKKNGSVLKRLHKWLDEAPDDVRRTLPVLVIDDEADQASIDTKGSYLAENEPLPDDYTEPSVINRLIRELLNKFNRISYVAYTATPFANILIPHDTYNPQYENDLYPKDFIVDIPKPDGYFGAEEQFGRFDSDTNEKSGGLDIIRFIPEDELDNLKMYSEIPKTLEYAMLDFVLAGAARAQRGKGNDPATMLLHGSHLIIQQNEIAAIVTQRFSELRDEWRYQRSLGILESLRTKWYADFSSVTSDVDSSRDVGFGEIEPFIGPFFESVQVRVINSSSGDVLDYEREPNLKAIAVGGNRLSRGLTLEGLLTSYFFRSTAMYDTLMQMGRWFGFRGGYEDLTRIYMTSDLAGWFSDLALVEYELRQDIRMYEAQNLTPLELGTRIVKHPAMLVTNRIKQRFAKTITIEQSYSGQVVQTFRFPFNNLNDLSILTFNNINATKNFIRQLGKADWRKYKCPVWSDVSPDLILSFLNDYETYPEARNISLNLIIAYIKKQLDNNELTNWTVAVRGRIAADPILDEIDLGMERLIPMISRTRLSGDSESLGVITNPGDEEIGLIDEKIKEARQIQENSAKKIGLNPAARMVRPATDGLLLIYPVSSKSGYEKIPPKSRRPIYEKPDESGNNNIMCFAISFPVSKAVQGIKGEYVIGTVDWRPL